MTPDEFRRHGKEVVDWIADYLEGVESLPVRAQVAPGDVRRALPEHPPEHGEDFAGVLADLDRIVVPGLTHWQHPSFFAYYPSNTSGPAILGDLLSSGLGVQGMLWATSPACTELETVVVDWLAELFDMPDHFRTDDKGGGVIQDSASSAALLAILAALQRLGDTARRGLTGRHTLYVSTETHSALAKGARIAGIGADNVRVVDVDPETLGMDVAKLDRMIAEDVAAGAVPVLVCATIGTTSTAAVDPVWAIGEVCRKHDVWLHVDAAYAGVAAVCPEFRWLNDGVAEFADSYATNPHKWLLTNFDCTVMWVADRVPLIGALAIHPEFLRNAATASGAVVDYRDWQVSLGRRFRSLKLWAVLRWYGAEGLREHIRAGVSQAAELRTWVAEDPDFALHEPQSLGLVCFRPLWSDPEAGDEATLRLMESLNDSGALYLTHTKVSGHVVLRMALGGARTEQKHVRAAWEAIRAEYLRLR
jgi:aromatic-L-amino-acid/L-tryptophan decarboxylase